MKPKDALHLAIGKEEERVNAKEGLAQAIKDRGKPARNCHEFVDQLKDCDVSPNNAKRARIG